MNTSQISRVLCWFSCGAASAAAAMLAVQKYGDRCKVLYCDTSRDEHPDNRRFLKDVEKWIGRKIIRLKNPEYDDRWDVYRKTGFLVSPRGARCTVELKKRLRFEYQQPDDVHVMGYTLEEQHRVKRFHQGNPEVLTDFILLEKGLKKSDCLALLERSGIKLPAMYEMGYQNNNCIGCVKGGKGYWNKIRKDFPDYFARMAALERELNRHVLSDCFLDELPKGGRYPYAEPLSCSAFCELAYQGIKAG